MRRGSETMRPLKALGICLFAALAIAAATAAAATPPVKHYTAADCPDPYANTAACAALHDASAQPHPGLNADRESKALAHAAFTGDYNPVWNFLSPQLQSAVSHSKWLSCQKHNPVAPPGLRINRIAVANSLNIPMSLPHFGHQKIFQVQLQVIYTRSGQEGAALVFAYWLHNDKGKWVAVWPAAVYNKYRTGSCDQAGPTRGLY
jgi:hypothetical protein